MKSSAAYVLFFIFASLGLTLPFQNCARSNLNTEEKTATTEVLVDENGNGLMVERSTIGVGIPGTNTIIFTLSCPKYLFAGQNASCSVTIPTGTWATSTTGTELLKWEALAEPNTEFILQKACAYKRYCSWTNVAQGKYTVKNSGYFKYTNGKTYPFSISMLVNVLPKLPTTPTYDILPYGTFIKVFCNETASNSSDVTCSALVRSSSDIPSITWTVGSNSIPACAGMLSCLFKGSSITNPYPTIAEGKSSKVTAYINTSQYSGVSVTRTVK
jgi:hypothetical protein